jgi:hypothetical protein
MRLLKTRESSVIAVLIDRVGEPALKGSACKKLIASTVGRPELANTNPPEAVAADVSPCHLEQRSRKIQPASGLSTLSKEDVSGSTQPRGVPQ